MNDLRDKIGRLTGGDGPLLVALFGLLALAAAAFWTTAAWLAPRDTTARFVPLAAFAYIHSDERGSSLAMPGNWTADEAAEFGLAIDGQPLWGTILVWKRGRPTEAEQLRLDLATFQLDKRTYLIADDRLVDRVGRDAAAERSLVSSPAIVSELTVALWLMPTQAYFQPAAMPEELLPGPMKWLKQAPPLVAAWGADERGLFGTIIPLNGAAPENGAATAVWPIGPLAVARPANVELWGNFPSFDPLTVFFNKAEGQRRTEGLSDSSSLVEARASLAETLGRPFSLAIMSGEPAGDVEVVAYYPTMDITLLKSRSLAFLNALIPIKKPGILPDGTKTTEIVFDQQKFSFREQADQVISLLDENTDFGFYIAKKGENGAYLATNSALFSEIQAGESQETWECLDSKGPGFLIDRQIAEKMLDFSEFKPYFKMIEADSLRLLRNELNERLVFCGQ